MPFIEQLLLNKKFDLKKTDISSGEKLTNSEHFM